ncbi:hypothetical protein IWZ00DRAFT_574966 [Phyllosticta capitalensis]|uniref:uncharacterized protein n=1 Tax=Phyllosticta capitalensis TaxID=121624 RepID=UPI003131815A
MARSANRKPRKRARVPSSSPYTPTSTKSPKRPKRRGRPPKQKSAPVTDDFFPAKSILAEDPQSKKYLVEWEGLDPKTRKPFDPTWEPYDFCTEELVIEWKQKQYQDHRLHSDRDSDEEEPQSERASPPRTPTGSREPTPSVRHDLSSRSSSSSLLEPPNITSCGSPIVVPSPLTAAQLAEYDYYPSQELELLHTAVSSQLNDSEKSIGFQSQVEDARPSSCGTQIPPDNWASPPKARRFSDTAIVADSQSVGVPSDHIPSTQPSLGDSGTAVKTATASSQLDCPFAGAESAHSVAHCLLNSSAVIPETQPLATATQQSNHSESAEEKAAPSPGPIIVQQYTQESAEQASNTEEQEAAPGVSVVNNFSGEKPQEQQSEPRSPQAVKFLLFLEEFAKRVDWEAVPPPAAVEHIQTDNPNRKSCEQAVRASPPKLDGSATQSQSQLSLQSQHTTKFRIPEVSQRDLEEDLTQESNCVVEQSQDKDDQSEQVDFQPEQSPFLWLTAKSHISREAVSPRASSPCGVVSQKPEATPRANHSATDDTQSSELQTRFAAFEPEVDLNEPHPSSFSFGAEQSPGSQLTSLGLRRSNHARRSISRDPTDPPHHPGASTSRSRSPQVKNLRSETAQDYILRYSKHLREFNDQRGIAKANTDEKDPTSEKHLRQTRSLTGSPALKAHPLSNLLALSEADHRLGANSTADKIEITSHQKAEQDIADAHDIDRTQSETVRQHDSNGDADMLDAEGEEQNRDDSRSTDDLEPFMAIPYTAEREYLVGLSMEGVQGNQYRSTMNYLKETIVAFTEFDSQEAQAMEKEAEDLLTGIRNILTHVDLHFQSADALTQHEDAEAEAAEWSKNAAAKFRFLGHLFERLRWEEKHIVLVAKAGETQRLVETFVKGSNFQYSADHGGENVARFNPQPDWPHGKLFISILNPQSTHVGSKSADLMVSLDPYFELSPERSIWPLREELEHESGDLLPLITPIITNSLEHIERCISPSNQGIHRTQILVRFMTELRNRAGRVDEGSMVDRAAEAVANALTSSETSDDMEKGGKFEGVPTLGSVADLVTSMGGSISPISISSAAHQTTSETPGPSKRQLEDVDEEPAKRLKTAELKSESKSKSQILRESLAYTQHRLEEHVKALEACQATNEEQKDIILGLRQELQDNKAEVAKASERIERQTDIISKLKDEKVTLEESLAEARTALETSAIPEISQQERMRQERDEALKSLENSKKAQESQDRVMDFIREQYQEASSSAVESSAEKDTLTQQVRELRRQVASEMERARKLSLSSASNAWKDEVEKLQAQLRDRDDMIRRQSEEIKNMRPRQGVGTRAGSVPRSPRIMGGGPGSRGGSPAPSGLGGRVERLRNLNA